MESRIPALYETEKIPLQEKIIYQKWEIAQIGFYWLISELDRQDNIAFGYANLNDDIFAEWGYISMEEIIDCGASPDKEWRPCPFYEAQEIVKRGKCCQR